MLSKNAPAVYLALLTTLALDTACRVRNEDHCAWQDGNQTCQDRYDDGRRFCAMDCVKAEGKDGCVEIRPEDDACYSPCGNGMTFLECSGVADDGTSTEATAEGTEEPSSSEGTTEGSTTAEESTTSLIEEASGESSTVPECSDAQPCSDTTRPFCADGMCVPCGEAEGDASCVSLGGTRNLCIDNACVECTTERPEACIAEQHVCDVASSTCVPCTAHEQCGTGDEAACHIEAGTCFSNDPGSVYDVDATENAVTEFTSIEDALLEVGEGEQAVVVLHGTTNFDEACTLEGNRVVAFKLAGDASPNLLWIQSQSDPDPGDDVPTLDVSNGATVYLVNLRLRGNLDDSAAVVAANGATVHIEDGDISDNTGLAISADNARVEVDGVRITNNDGGGIAATANSNITLTNVFVSGPEDAIAVAVDGSTLEMLYGSIGAGAFDSRALQCTGASTVRVRNSLLLTRGDLDAVNCPGATIDNSAVSGTLVDVAGNNTLDVVVDPDWFTGYNSGDFHLVDGHPFDSIAVWQDGDPPTDIDGDPRPMAPGPDVAGADVPTNP